MNSTSFGNKIYTLRKAKNLTQAQLAEILGVSDKTISRWETGEGFPEITSLKPLADALGVTVDELLSDSNKEKNNYGFEQNANKKVKIHKEIPVVWSYILGKRFWRSLTIFNKISWLCFILSIGTILISYLGYILLHGDMPYFWATITSLIYTNLPRIGFISAVIGLVAGILDLYDRQTKTSIILLLLNTCIIFIIPLLFYILFQLILLAL